MLQIAKECKIYVLNTPISARYGIPAMFDMLLTDQLGLMWNGVDPILIIAFNKKRTLCKVFSVDAYGCTCATRKLAAGKFKFEFNSELIPSFINKKSLEHLFNYGSLKV